MRFCQSFFPPTFPAVQYAMYRAVFSCVSCFQLFSAVFTELYELFSLFIFTIKRYLFFLHKVLCGSLTVSYF